MAVDLIRYDILAQEALRGLVRSVLVDAAKKGLPGDHHFYITFDTKAEGVRLSSRLIEQYPEEMTIVLQHQFWDLKVGADSFEVGLSFGGVPERLFIPFEAVTSFRDPSVQFALQFETLDAAPEATAEPPAHETVEATESKPATRPRSKSRTATRQGAARTGITESRNSKPDSSTAVDSGTAADKPGGQSPDKPGAEVVRLDRFRKK